MSCNAEAEAFFTPLSAHSDVASALSDALSKAKLGDYATHTAARESARYTASQRIPCSAGLPAWPRRTGG